MGCCVAARSQTAYIPSEAPFSDMTNMPSSPTTPPDLDLVYPSASAPVGEPHQSTRRSSEPSLLRLNS